MSEKGVLITGVAGLIGSRMADWIIENKPDYLIIAGDLLDRSNYKYQDLLKFLEQIAKITILIIVLGNHDYYINNKDKTISNGVNQEFIKKLNNLNNT